MYSGIAVDAFIGKIFAMKCDANFSFDYSKPLSRLKNLDNALFYIVTDYIHAWKECDIETALDFRSLNLVFYDRLIEWANGKTFTDKNGLIMASLI